MTSSSSSSFDTLVVRSSSARVIRQSVTRLRSTREGLRPRMTRTIAINSIIVVSTSFEEISIATNLSRVSANVSISVINVSVSINNSSLASRRRRENKSNCLRCAKRETSCKRKRDVACRRCADLKNSCISIDHRILFEATSLTRF